MNKILAAISMVFAAGLLLAVPPSAFATQKEACTPGYWKNNTDTNGWYIYDNEILQDYIPELSGPPITLYDAVRLHGGGENAVKRYAAAAVYNELAGLNYPEDWLEEAIERYVSGNISGAIEKFERIHNESICTIDAHGDPI